MSESYLVVDACEYPSAAWLTCDPGEKISVRKVFDNFSPHTHPLFYISSILPATVIVNMPSSEGYSAESQFSFSRTTPRVPMSPVEFENALSQALTSTTSMIRPAAAAYMNLPELDTMLVEGRGGSFSLDGRPVASPVGQQGSVLSGTLQLIFTSRPVFERWHKYFNGSRDFHFTLNARANISANHSLNAPAKSLHILPDCSVALCREGEKDISSGGNRLNTRKSDVGWRAFTGVVSSDWGISESSARRVLEAFGAEEVSPHIKKRLQKSLDKPSKSFFSSLGRIGVSSGEWQVDAPAWFPISFPLKKRNLRLSGADADRMAESRGLVLHRGLLSPREAAVFVAPFLEFYYHNKRTPMNHWLKKRVHWLTPS